MAGLSKGAPELLALFRAARFLKASIIFIVSCSDNVCAKLDAFVSAVSMCGDDDDPAADSGTEADGLLTSTGVGESAFNSADMLGAIDAAVVVETAV